jgi:hypothetical protein
VCKNNFNFRQRKSEIAKIILLQQKFSIKRCYFQFKKDIPKHKKCQFPLGNLVTSEVLPTKSLDGHSQIGPKKIVNG